MITQIAVSIGFHQLPGLIDSPIKVLFIGEFFRPLKCPCQLKALKNQISSQKKLIFQHPQTGLHKQDLYIFIYI